MLAGLAGWGEAARAQTAVDGAIAGQVLRADGSAVPGVSVVIRLVETPETEEDDPQGCGPRTLASQHSGLANARARRSGARLAVEKRELRTGRDGSFVALRVLPGDYLVQGEDGAGQFVSQCVTVELGETTELTLRASRGNGAPVQNGPTPAQWPEKSSVAAARLQLPLEAERWVDLAHTHSEIHEAEEEAPDSATDPATGDGSGADSGGGGPSFRAVSATQNVSLLDGLSGAQAFSGTARGSSVGGARGLTDFSGGTVRAFRVSAHGYSAQYGGGAGGIVMAARERGGAAVHGGVRYGVRSSAWASANPYSVATRYRDGVISNSLVKPADLFQQVEGRVGGPIAPRWLQGRVFGFGSVEQQLRNFPAVASPAYSAVTGSFYSLSAIQVALLGNRGVTAAATRVALNYLDSLTGELPRRADRGLQFARLDVRASARDSVALSYARSRLSAAAGSGSGPSTAVVSRGLASVGDRTIRIDAVTARWLHAFSPRVTNEVRAQYARDLEFEQPRAPLPLEPGIGPGGYAPQVSIAAGAFVYGTPAGFGRNAYPDEDRVQAAEVVQWAPGRHILMVGGDWSRVEERVDALNNTDGSFRYDSGATNGRAGGLVDWITDFTFNVRAYPNGGCPAITAANHLFCFRSFTQSFGQQQVDFMMHEFAGFAQDVWRVRPGLTVQAGARYEYTLLPLPQQPNAALDAAFSARGATSIFPEDRNNAGPRVAISWSPGPRAEQGRWGTVRLGFGSYFGRVPGSVVRAALVDTALPATATHIHITPATVTACPQVANQGFGYPCAYVSAPPAAIAATTSAVVFARNFRLPAVQQAELTVEREFGGRATARATYSMALARQLPNSVDINIAPSTGLGTFLVQGGDGRAGVRDGEMFVVPVYTARVAAQFGPVAALTSNANATWHALTVEGRLRAHAGWQARGSYTWSKAIDYGPNQGISARSNGQFDPFSVGYDKGLADGNVPHRFSGDAVWTTRLPKGAPAVRRILTGWRVAAVGSASSGRPYSYGVFGGTRLSGGAYSLNGSGGSTYLPTVGRNTLRLPVRWAVDARVGRGFRLFEHVHGEGYAEALNLTNHVNASRVNARAFLAGEPVQGVTPLVFQDAATVAAEGLNTPPFGTVTSSTSAFSQERRLQVGVRFDF
jgi:hypothetical protein